MHNPNMSDVGAVSQEFSCVSHVVDRAILDRQFHALQRFGVVEQSLTCDAYDGVQLWAMASQHLSQSIDGCQTIHHHVELLEIGT